jgi:two-component system, OmpR family, osmolarity sensor histidine kinase EnvZ
MMFIKKILPKSLFGRALLILVVPTLLIQLVVAYVFFDRHWGDVTRHMSTNMAGEVVFFVGQLQQSTPGRQRLIAEDFAMATGISVFFDERDHFDPARGTDEFAQFQTLLRLKLKEPVTVRKIHKGSTIEICTQLDVESICMEMTAKRLESRTTTIFILWMMGATVIFLLIAIVFLRNQIRPITRLAEAADSFGRGVDLPEFRPHGANEVRRAARAFVVMRERIKRQMRTRTEMLAGISHDLRTPLTRIKLQLAMLGEGEAVKELSDDVQQMEHMIQEYLDFARGEGREEAIRLRLAELLDEVVMDYQRSGANVVLNPADDAQVNIRVSAFRRMLHNVIDNALRYGTQCELEIQVTPGSYVRILIDDNGPGIPKEKRDEVFKPFNRLDPSRNMNTGGVGLGLTIARDVVLAHGGTISLDEAPAGGLRVVVQLPL